MAQAVGGGLEGDGAVELFGRGTHDTEGALSAVAAVAQPHAVEPEGFGFSERQSFGDGKSCVGYKHLVLIVTDDGKQALVGGIGVVCDVHRRNELLSAVPLLQGVVEVHEFALVGHLEQGIYGFEQDAVAVLEDLQLRIIDVQALGKGDERPDCVPQVVGALGEVSVG